MWHVGCILKFADDCFSALNLRLHVQMFVIKLSLSADKLIFFVVRLALAFDPILTFSFSFFVAYPLVQISIENAVSTCLFYFLSDTFETCSISMCSTSSNDLFLFCSVCVSCAVDAVSELESLICFDIRIDFNACSCAVSHRSAFETKRNQLLIKRLCNGMNEKKLR